MNFSKMSTGQKVVVGIGMAVAVFLVFAVIVSVQVLLYCGLAMLICNIILPLFDVGREITFAQGLGIGVVVTVIVGILHSIFGGKKS